MLLKFFRNVFYCCVLTLITISSALAGGLALLNYGEVMVENLSIGQEYSMLELVNLPLIVKNKEDNEIKIGIEIICPANDQIKPGFEPIPSAAWLKISPLETIIAANNSFQTDVKLAIPDDPKLQGKKFQADIKVSVIPDKRGPVNIALAVKGRLLFTISAQKTSKEISAPKNLNLNFEIIPNRIKISDMPLGKKVKIQTLENTPIKISNKSESTLKLFFQSLNPSETVLAEDPEYAACQQPEFISFDNEEIQIAKNQSSKLGAYLFIPDTPEYKGKKLLFLISVSTGSANIGKRYIPVLVSVKN
jgi:hypothetical protein